MFLFKEEARAVSHLREPLINAPVDFSKKGFMEFNFSQKFDVPFHITVFLYIDKPNRELPEEFQFRANAKLIDSDGNIIKEEDIKKECASWGYPVIEDFSGTLIPLLNITEDLSGNYKLQLTLDEITGNLPPQGLTLKASYMSSMPIMFNASLHWGIVIISAGIAIIALLIAAILHIFKKKTENQSNNVAQN